MSASQRFLSTLAHPNVAYILLTLGFIGLFFEVTHPGMVAPGVVGAICMVLGFYAMSVLPVDFAGVALILLAMLFFIAEVKVTSYGLLTVAGVVSLVIGSLMLFKSPDPAIRVSLWVIAAVAASIVVAALFLMAVVMKTHRTRVATGVEGLVGKIAVARTPLAPRGRVFVHGEIWSAASELPVAAGADVVVVAVEGMQLKVRPVAVAPAEQPLAPPGPGGEELS